VRVATYNIRNVRALDWHSLWLRRRRRLVGAVRAVDADVWGLQESYAVQLRWLEKKLWSPAQWDAAAPGRNSDGGGESAAVYWRTDNLALVSTSTRWYGSTPEVPGSRIPGAGAPRIATLVEFVTGSGDRFLLANTHLDDKSVERRHTSVTQLAEWIVELAENRPIVVLGDFNCALDASELEPLMSAGLTSALSFEDGPTTNEFGRETGKQLDHIFVSTHWQIESKGVHSDAGFASDHFPVFADIRLR
jgi:endonuclease/exonuclease/phosphatase family metal-dependent hydrolase